MSSRFERAARGRWGAAIGRRRYAAVVFALLTGLLGCWCLATPPFGGVDENGHIFRASSIAGGQLVASRDGAQGYGTAATLVFVPGSLANLGEDTACRTGLFGPRLPCDAARLATTDVAAVPSGAARYDPAYYLVLSLGALTRDPVVVVYLMRALSILMCAGLLTVAFAAARHAESRLGALAILLALTPMALFVLGTVNPSGLETAAALGVWTLGLRATSRADPLSPRGWSCLSACASVMVLSRTISSLWLILILVVLCGRAGRTRLREIGRTRRFWTAASVVAAAATLNLAWTLYSGVLRIAPPVGRSATHHSFAWALLETWRESGGWWKQAVGVLGYLNVDLPSWVYLASMMAFALFVAAAAPGASRSASAVVVLVALLVSVFVAAANFNTLGVWWQGRYLLPLLVGAPLLLAHRQRHPARRDRALRLRVPRMWTCLAAAALVPVVDLGALHALLARAASPTHWAVSHGGGWQPPVPPIWILSASALLLAGLVWLCVVPVLAAPPAAPDPADRAAAAGNAGTKSFAPGEPPAVLNR